LKKPVFEKLFSIQEVDELIPRLEFLIRGLQAEARLFRQRLSELAQTRPGHQLDPNHFDQIIQLCPELRHKAQAMAEFASRIEAFGGTLKDIDLGLVDFPAEIDGKVVYLCWQFGEAKVRAWHPLNAGFAERRPLQGTPKSYLN
jgi:hypothetical protein